jgi:hypothetical protein
VLLELIIKMELLNKELRNLPDFLNAASSCKALLAKLRYYDDVAIYSQRGSISVE